MLYANVYVFARQLRWIDALTVMLAAVVVWLPARHQDWWDPESQAAFPIFAFMLTATFTLIAGRLNLYHTHRTGYLRHELSALFEACGLAGGIACLVSEISTAGLPGQFYAAVVFVAVLALIVPRFILRMSLRMLRRKGRDLRWWLVVGRNERAERLVNEVVTHPSYGIAIAGVVDFCDGGKTSSMSPRSDLEMISGFEHVPLTDEQDFRDLLSRIVVDEVVMCLPIRSHYDHIERLVGICEEAGISVMLPPKIFGSLKSRSDVKYIGPVPMVALWTGPDDWDKLMIKRLFDLFVSATALMLLSPILVAIAVLLKLTSPGPVLFKQTRIGLHGRPFEMIKFRTMVTQAPTLQDSLRQQNECDGPAFKIRNDPRITPIGRLLRKYHLDEMPQFWNVLVGDMSIVGPRPLPPSEAVGDQWWQRRRLSMPPGLTCIWQSKGDHKIPFEEWMRLDLDYIDRWSLSLDIRILAATAVTLARGTGW